MSQPFKCLTNNPMFDFYDFLIATPCATVNKAISMMREKHGGSAPTYWRWYKEGKDIPGVVRDKTHLVKNRVAAYRRTRGI